MYFLLKMGMFHCYVSVPEGIPSPLIWGSFHKPSILGSRNLNQSRFHGMSCSRIYVSAYGFMKIRSIHPPKKLRAGTSKSPIYKGKSSSILHYYVQHVNFLNQWLIVGLGPGGLDIWDPRNERDCYLGVPWSNPKPQTPQTTNLPLVDYSKLGFNLPIPWCFHWIFFGCPLSGWDLKKGLVGLLLGHHGHRCCSHLDSRSSDLHLAKHAS